MTYDSLSCDMTISRDNDLLFSADMAEIVNAGTSKSIDPAQIITDGNLGRFPVVTRESKLVKGCPQMTASNDTLVFDGELEVPTGNRLFNSYKRVQT